MKKIISIVMVLIIIFGLSIGTYQNTYADGTLSWKNNMILISILLAGGIAFSSEIAAKNAVNMMYNSWTNAQKTAADTMFSNVVGGICAIPDEVWTLIMNYINTKYTVGSSTITPNQIWDGFPMSPSKLSTFPYQLIYFNTSDSTYRLVCSTTPIYYDNLHIGHTQGQWNYFKLGDGTWISLATNTNEVIANVTNLSLIATNCIIYTSIALSTVYTGADTAIPDVINYVGSDSVANPAYDFETPEGKREVGVPVESVDDWSWFNDKTQSNIQNPSIDGDLPTDVPVTGDIGVDFLNGKVNIITGLVSSMSLVFGSVSDILQILRNTATNIYDKTAEIVGALTGGITTKLGEIVGALTGAIASSLSTVIEKLTNITTNTTPKETTEESATKYGLPDMFNLLLLIFLAILAFILAFINMVINLKGVLPSSELLPSGIKSVIDFIHTAHIPGFELTFMQILVIFGAIMIAIRIMRVIRSDVFHASTYVQSDKGQYEKKQFEIYQDWYENMKK